MALFLPKISIVLGLSKYNAKKNTALKRQAVI